MNRRHKGFLVGALISLSACVAGLHVKEVEIANAASPATFTTYRWALSLMREATVEEHTETRYSEMIQSAMDRVLRHHGYRRADDDAEAMIVAFQITVKDSVETHESMTVTDPLDETLNYGLRWRLSAGDKPLRLERMSPAEEIRYLEEGTLHIGAFAPDQSPLWHAMGHKIVNRSHMEDEHRAVLEKSVARILARFPPQNPNDLRRQSGRTEPVITH